MVLDTHLIVRTIILIVCLRLSGPSIREISIYLMG